MKTSEVLLVFLCPKERKMMCPVQPRCTFDVYYGSFLSKVEVTFSSNTEFYMFLSRYYLGVFVALVTYLEHSVNYLALLMHTSTETLVLHQNDSLSFAGNWRIEQ